MLKATPFAPSARTYAAQEAYLAIEQKPRDKAEKRLLEKARAYVQAHAHQADLRDLAPALRELMGAGYLVGSGSAHTWIKRAQGEGDDAAPERLAIVADRLTTAVWDWFEPKLPTGPRPSSRPEHGLPIPNQLPTTSAPTSLFAVVYQDDLEKDGRSTVFFNVGTPNPHFKHYAQKQSSNGGQAATMRGLLAQVRQDHPQAREEEVNRTTWIVRE